MNKYKYRMMFFQEDAGGGEGGGGDGGVKGIEVFTPPTKLANTENQLPPAKSSPGETAAPKEGPSTSGAETPPAAPPPFDSAKFAKDFGTSISEALRPVIEKRDEPELTVEEARKILQVWEPGDDWFRQYDNLETRKTAVEQMRDALVTQADTLATMRMKDMMDKFRDEFMPHLEEVKQYAETQREERFTTKYPQLGNPGLKPLLVAVANDLVGQGKKFNTESELFTELAKGVESVIKINNPEFKLETAASSGADGSNNNAKGGRRTGGIPSVTPGSGGGAGRREGTQQPAKARGLAIFDK